MDPKTHVQLLFDNSPNAIIIYEVKNKGASSYDYIIQDVNPASLKIEKWHKKDVLGKPLGEVRPGVDNFGIIGAFQKVLKTGEPLRYPETVYEDYNEQR
ncbi:MAG: PAS domain-containing protein [Clostridiales bacterium]|nr:PAS domain-containing protein [Clostridiales bacterium]